MTIDGENIVRFAGNGNETETIAQAFNNADNCKGGGRTARIAPFSVD